MKRFLVAMFVASSICVIGCKSDNDDMKAKEPMKMSMDVCDHCPGVQTATADGKCSACGMKLPAAK